MIESSIFEYDLMYVFAFNAISLSNSFVINKLSWFSFSLKINSSGFERSTDFFLVLGALDFTKTFFFF